MDSYTFSMNDPHTDLVEAEDAGDLNVEKETNNEMQAIVDDKVYCAQFHEKGCRSAQPFLPESL